ncbi:HpcH/HpaI aldolase/citrate lyase family protein [Thalassovita taeanensis]|uniref:Citrate lyase subunit beta / citryl-CoA lyase n=1 Tax=Thalassovita taeanensis TaxID=657014 RepID=A0A1H9H8P9_9RHOB|nr:CoA ester lyase [Thalassovita taeanensis]SEQ58646.1 citrate lyase subunit beta / citryl-CoA lyase [Thalassovita taeanensis]
MTTPSRPPLPAFSFPLFVPGNRPERIAKARATGTDTIIVDLEDAVAEAGKVAARGQVRAALSEAHPVATFLRINAADTVWHQDDLALISDLAIAGVVLPKAETAAGLARVRAALPSDQYLIALVETARGLDNVRDIARNSDRIAFGSIDYCADLGCEHSREALLFARSQVVLAARLADQPSPLDGVTTSINDAAEIQGDAAYGSSLGFAGKLLIHPAQITPAKQGFAPKPEALDWATRVLDSSQDGAARVLDGTMVDAPVIMRARNIIARMEALK